MQLGKKKKSANFLQAIAHEDGLDASVVEAAGNHGDAQARGLHKQGSAAANPPGAPAQRTEKVEVTVAESIVCTLNRDGGLVLLDVRGSLSLTCHDPECAKVKARISSCRSGAPKFQFQTHPNISKPMYKRDGVLALKDVNRPFPIGSAVGVLKWRLNTKDEQLVPLTINCWPESVGANQLNVNIEYNLEAPDLELHVHRYKCSPRCVFPRCVIAHTQNRVFSGR